MAKNTTEADLAKLRKRWADEDAGLIPKKKLTEKEKFNQQMMNQSVDRAEQALRPKKPRKPKF